MVEKRRYPRVPVRYDVMYRDISAKINEKKWALVENASRLGLKIKFSGLVKKNDILELAIYKSPASDPINAYGKVIWEKDSALVYGEKEAGIFLTKVGWTETAKLVNPYMD